MDYLANGNTLRCSTRANGGPIIMKGSWGDMSLYNRRGIKQGEFQGMRTIAESVGIIGFDFSC